MNQFDIFFFTKFNSLAGTHSVWDWIIIFWAEYSLYFLIGGIMLWAGITLIPKLHSYRIQNVRFAAFTLGAGIFSRFFFTEIIRFFYDRPRPFEVLSNVGMLISHEKGGSFPSGHAAFSFAVATAAAYYYPKTSIFLFLVAILMGVARISAGIHWPSDIVAGAVVGVLGAWTLRLVRIKLKGAAYAASTREPQK